MQTIPQISLSSTESETLKQHEQIIERGLKTFYEVGAALMAIRDERLYRASHSTFEDYCRERWQMDHNYANKIVRAADVMKNLGTIVPILPANEAQARPLTSLPPEQQTAVWQAVIKDASDGKITAKQVQSAVKRIQNVNQGLMAFPENQRGVITQLCSDNDEKINILKRLFKSQGRPETNGTYQEILDTGGFHYGDEMDQWVNFTTAPIEQIHSGLLSVAEYHAMLSIQNKAPIMTSSEGVEYYTPAVYLEAARRVMGTIDLDPASCEIANKQVQAATYYTMKDNGLIQPWSGNVWLNPPYGSLADDFGRQVIERYQSGEIKQAITLFNAHVTDTRWFADFWNYLVCFTDHRINFLNTDDKSGSTHGSCFVYLGDNCTSFIQEFKAFGVIVKRVDQ